MPIYFSSKKFKVAIMYNDKDIDNNGVFIFSEPSLLRQISDRVLRDKPDLKFLNRECSPAFHEKKGCCLVFSMARNLEGKTVPEYRIELTESIEYFKDLVNIADCFITQPFEYTSEEPEVKDIGFDEQSSTFLVKIANWERLAYNVKRKFIYAFLEVMSKVSGLKIVGDGGVIGDKETDKKTFAIIVTSEGFGWRFAGTPKPDLLRSIIKLYAETVENFTEEEADKYKISDLLINKINWLSSLDPIRW